MIWLKRFELEIESIKEKSSGDIINFYVNYYYIIIIELLIILKNIVYLFN